MSSYTNITIPNRNAIDVANRDNLVKQEAVYWRTLAYELMGTLANIPAALQEHGFVDFQYNGATLRAVTPQPCVQCLTRDAEDNAKRELRAAARRKAAEPRNKVTSITKGKRRGK